MVGEGKEEEQVLEESAAGAPEDTHPGKVGGQGPTGQGPTGNTSTKGGTTPEKETQEEGDPHAGLVMDKSSPIASRRDSWPPRGFSKQASKPPSYDAQREWPGPQPAEGGRRREEGGPGDTTKKPGEN